MHVLLVCHHYPPEVGAPQRRWNAFVREWRRQGVDVTVVTSLPHYPLGRLLPGERVAELLGRRIGQHGETVIRLPFLRVGGRGGALKLGDQAFVAMLSAIAGSVVSRPDLVVTSIPGPFSLAAGDWLAARWRIPHIVELRDAWPDLLFEGSPGSVRIPSTFGTWMTARQRRADAVVTVTRTFGEVLASRGIHPGRIHHIPNGIDIAQVPTLTAPDMDRRPLRVLYLGTHGISQGLESAVQALAAVTRPIEARFIGEGTEKARLVALAEQLSAPIAFHPPVVGDALWDAYAWADTCLVHLADWPSFRFTVPSKLYEVMAAGRHVTGALAGEAADIVRRAAGGAVVEPGRPEQLAALLQRMTETRQQTVVGTGPREWVESHYDLTALAETFRSLIERVAT